MAKVKNYIRCEECHSLAFYEPYLKEYQCKKCGWQGRKPVASYIKEIVEDTGVTEQELLQLIDNLLKLSYLSGNYDIGELDEMKDYLEREVMFESD